MSAPRAADDRCAEIQGVLHVARGMVGRHVQGFEVVVVVLDLGSLEDLVTHVGEDVFHLLPDAHQRVHAADRDRSAGEGHVYCASGRDRRLDSRALVVQRRFDL